MAYLINRTPVARLRCLHTLTKLINYQFGKKIFFMGDLLYSRNRTNIHKFCDLIQKDPSLKIKYCPFLNNPLSRAGCYLTRGVQDDTTKKKEISNTVNALDGLGILVRLGRKLQLTPLGCNFANLKFESYKWLTLARQCLLKYGPAIGLLYQIHVLQRGSFKSSRLLVGYPDAGETVVKNGKRIKISSGSRKDSNTRTKSTLLAWAVTAGFLVPSSLRTKVRERKSQVDTESYILQPIRNTRFYVKKYFPRYIFSGDFVVDVPLDYCNLSKNIGALREHGQATSRIETLNFKNVILNRRFAIVYLLNKAFTKKRSLHFLKLVNLLKKEDSMFVINKIDFENVMKTDSFIAYIAGIPYERAKGDILKPVTGINSKILNLNAPKKIIDYLNDITDQVLV